MSYKGTIEEAVQIVVAIKELAPDIKTGGFTLPELEELIAKGEAEDRRSELLRGQVSASVATKHNLQEAIQEYIVGMVHGIRASKHPMCEEILRFLGYKMSWEFGIGMERDSAELPPPSGQSPLAA